MSDLLKDKIKTGWFYKIETGPPIDGERELMTMTGSGGILNYIDKCREQGLPDYLIEESIFITNSESMTTNMKWYPISIIVWKQTPDGKKKNNDEYPKVDLNG